VTDEHSAKLPSYKDSTKYFAYPGVYAPNAPFRWFPPTRLLTPNGLKIVQDFRESAGEFLGGGVMKSKQLEAKAEQSETARAIKAQVLAQSRYLSKRETVRLSTQITSEWIALEYALILSVTLYGHITPIKWDKLESLTVRKKGFAGFESIATLSYVDGLGVKQVVDIQSGKPNIDSLASIAKAVGI
jgi:hypothetical protein